MLPAIAGLLLAVAGCGTEAGPTPKGQVAPPGTEALQIKLDALMVDQCFKNPAAQKPQGCEKYITQLGGTLGAIRDAAQPGEPELGEAANHLDRSIAAYRGNSCTSQAAPTQPCSGVLVDVANAVRTAKAKVDTMPRSR